MVSPVTGDGGGATLLVQDGRSWLRFDDPVRRIETRDAAEIPRALAAVEAAVEDEGLFAAGHLAYEAAAAWGLAVHPPAPDGPPLLSFTLTRSCRAAPPPAHGGPYRLGSFAAALDRAAYLRAVARIKHHLAAGDTYQVNLTFPLRAPFSGDPRSLMADLAAAQGGGSMAYLDTGRFVVCSASPELFLARRGERVESRPMKGTARRGRSTAEDDAAAAALAACAKGRAENLMIVDMVRNDLGRVAEVGSVAVPQLFTVERYPTVLQMTSSVTARCARTTSDLLAAAFPCASVTGAPKVRTMELIAELEARPRGLYTGAIGALLPGRRAHLNVAIRTVVVDRLRGEAVYGIGSGIVWNSEPAAEYEECLLKAAVLRERRPPFALLESILWEPEGGFFLLEEHLQRLAGSARYFGFPLERERLLAALSAATASLRAPAKLRLLAAAHGAVTVAAEPLGGAARDPLHLGLAPRPVDRASFWLYHKTTRRELYDAARAARPECDDVLLVNRAGEVTEATTANLVAELAGELVTPPVEAGLLPGTFREVLVRAGQVRERPLPVADLRRATRLWLVSSVRRWRAAALVDG